jgi:hypothetical protein
VALLRVLEGILGECQTIIQTHLAQLGNTYHPT